MLGTDTIAELLRFARKSRGLTQRAAAEQLATTDRTLHRWEHGTNLLPVFRNRIRKPALRWIRDSLDAQVPRSG